MKEQGTIFVDGRVVGYQFNKKSMGTRTFHRLVELQKDGTGLVKIGTLARVIRVKRLGNKSRFWEAY